MPYARLLQVIRIVGERNREDRKWEALWSYRANPPMEGEGKNKTVVPFAAFLARLKLEADDEVIAPEISDEEIEAMFKQGKMGLFPPGMKGV